LHLGHAYSALLNEQIAEKTGGRLLLRVEDIDPARCTREFEREIVNDLDWLGIVFDEPPRRQSDNVEAYADELRRLAGRDLIYACFCSRADIAGRARGLRDPDGSPPHVGRCAGGAIPGRKPGLRLDMALALTLAPRSLLWREYREGERGTLERANPAVWGDVLIKRADAPASYHLAVVIDDDSQGVSDVVRGRDLFHAASIHRLLQELLEIIPPRYHHHRLVCDATGDKMSKSARSKTLAHLRAAGVSPWQIRAMLGFGQAPSRRRGQLTLAVSAGPMEGAVGTALGAWAIN
jgi:glutamyl-Q tRNA(Asp) synthetase